MDVRERGSGALGLKRSQEPSTDATARGEPSRQFSLGVTTALNLTVFSWPSSVVAALDRFDYF